MKIYVASSWRNNIQPKVVEALRIQGHEVYDFKNPEPGDNGFHWSEIDPDWKQWTPAELKDALRHPIAVRGFNKDMNALDECDVCILVMPCGRSAHLEAGYALGAGKPTIILLADGEPELMYRMTPFIYLDIASVQGCIDYIADHMKETLAQAKVDELAEGDRCLGYTIGNPMDGHDYDCEYEFSGDISCGDCIFGPEGGTLHPRKNPYEDEEEADNFWQAEIGGNLPNVKYCPMCRRSLKKGGPVE